ncbi:MAG: helix-turn-helix domain-containing protein [Alphaproteobacteria bacterium]|jgi:transcriptional regulator with XRE-family HTH domain|nr:helix-turn-helix domain-containing protein [Alphaproteobacteria bacterium]
MRVIARKLRQRAKDLGLSHAEIARRAGLAENRFGNYANDERLPDFEAIIRLSAVLDTTPNYLIGFEDIPGPEPGRAHWLARLQAAAAVLADEDLELAVKQIEVLIAHRRQGQPGPAEEEDD